MPEITKEQVVDYLSNLTVMDIAKLTEELEEKWGVKAAPVAVGVAGGAPAAGAEPAAEPTEFNVTLTGFAADKKIQVIKTLREVLGGLGLKQAKELVESVPKPIKEAVSKDEAEETSKKMKEAGAEVKIEPA